MAEAWSSDHVLIRVKPNHAETVRNEERDELNSIFAFHHIDFMAPKSTSSASKPAKKRVKKDESSEDGNETYTEGEDQATEQSSESEGSIDSDDPDADSPKPKKRKIVAKSPKSETKSPAKAVKKAPAKVKKDKAVKDNDGTNLRVVKVAALHPAPKTDREFLFLVL